MIAKSTDTELKAELVGQITNRLRQLSPEKLATVREFVAFLASRDEDDVCLDCLLTPRDMALASQDTLKKFWDSPAEDAAWANL